MDKTGDKLHRVWLTAPPAGCAWAGVRIADLTREQLDAIEYDTRFSERRRREFAAGRWAARRAAAKLGSTLWQVPRGGGGEPLWPQGLVGSISHDSEWAIAILATATRYAGIGLDIEPLAPLACNEREAITTERERAAWSAAFPGTDGAWSAVLFAIKESSLKCIYPLCSASMSIEDIEVLPTTDGISIRHVDPFHATQTCFAELRSARCRFQDRTCIVCWIVADRGDSSTQ